MDTSDHHLARLGKDPSRRSCVFGLASFLAAVVAPHANADAASQADDRRQADATPLSPHFSLAEFIASEEAARRGIDNTPPPVILERLRTTASMLERIRTLLGDCAIQITSGYRNPALNAAVGGVDESDHLKGYAVDFVCPAYGSAFDVAELIHRSSIFEDVDQLILEYGLWVHVSFDPRRRRQALTAHRVDAHGRRETAYADTIRAVDHRGYLLG